MHAAAWDQKEKPWRLIDSLFWWSSCHHLQLGWSSMLMRRRKRRRMRMEFEERVSLMSDGIEWIKLKWRRRRWWSDLQTKDDDDVFVSGFLLLKIVTLAGSLFDSLIPHHQRSEKELLVHQFSFCFDLSCCLPVDTLHTHTHTLWYQTHNHFGS